MPAIIILLDSMWLAVAAGCLVALFVFEKRRNQRIGRTRRALAVLFSLFLLFPCLSASDDLIGIGLLSPRNPGRYQIGILVPSDSLGGPDFQLGLRLQALANFQAAAFHPAPAIFRSHASLPNIPPAFVWRSSLRQASRAPPFA